MKRFLSVALIFSLLFSFAACSAKNSGKSQTEPTAAPPPVIESKQLQKEFKDENGRTVVSVDVTLPQISENCEKTVMDYVNKTALEIFEEKCRFAENNIKNAAAFMDNSKSEKPWTSKVTFETTYYDSRFTCFLIKEYFSYTGGEADPSYQTKCFDLKTGEPCSALTFAIDKENKSVIDEELVNNIIIYKADKEFYGDAGSLSENQRKAIAENFSLDNFYLTEDGIAFYFDKSCISPTQSGVYECRMTWSEAGTVFYSPYELAAIEAEENASETA